MKTYRCLSFQSKKGGFIHGRSTGPAPARLSLQYGPTLWTFWGSNFVTCKVVASIGMWLVNWNWVPLDKIGAFESTTTSKCSYGPSPPGLNKNRVLTLKPAVRCGSRVSRVQPCLAKGLGVGLISGSSLLKYLLDLAIIITKNVAPRHKQFRNFATFLVYLAI